MRQPSDRGKDLIVGKKKHAMQAKDEQLALLLRADEGVLILRQHYPHVTSGMPFQLVTEERLVGLKRARVNRRRQRRGLARGRRLKQLCLR